jgi:hypothetical protein
MDIPMVMDYAWVGTSLAPMGFVVAVAEVGNPSLLAQPAQWKDGFENTLDWMIARNTSNYLLYDIKGMIDVNRIGVSGHSQGGVTSFWTTGIDSRVKVHLAMAPPSPNMPKDTNTSSPFYGFDPAVAYAPAYAAAHNINVPSMTIADSTDVIPINMSDDWYAVERGPKEFVAVFSNNTGGTMMGFNYGGHVDFLCCLLGIVPIDAQAHAMIEKYTKNWFAYWLQGDTSKYDALFGTEAQNDLSSGKLVNISWSNYPR